MKDYVRVSKFLSYVLRHKNDTGIRLDENGWAEIDEIIERAGFHLTREILDQAVLQNNKKRFKIDGNRIRASQGHSIDVELNLKEAIPPERLYHGTPMRKLHIVLSDGLKKMNRQYVHLSWTEDTARIVAKRHGEPIVLRVNSKLMHREGHKFYLSDNNVWLTDSVPSMFIWLLDNVE